MPILCAAWLSTSTRSSACETGREPIDRPDPGTAAEAALRKLKLPGIRINLENRCVDVESVVCLDSGTLELVACTKGSKEHESIVAVEAKAMHIHTALLLLGAKSGTPAMRKTAGEDGERWIDLPPSGSPVGVFLVIDDRGGKPVERPIGDFIAPAGVGRGDPPPAADAKKFPTHTFLFAGSHLRGAARGPRQYLSDESGNVISISTFGDELLCLPGIHGHENGSLLWEVDATHLPPVGTKVTLRLRPKLDS